MIDEARGIAMVWHYGIIVPALFVGDYGCFSASDSEAEICVNALEAIDLTLLTMAEEQFDIGSIVDKGILHYSEHEDYSHCDRWLTIEVNLSNPA